MSMHGHVYRSVLGNKGLVGGMVCLLKLYFVVLS